MKKILLITSIVLIITASLSGCGKNPVNITNSAANNSAAVVNKDKNSASDNNKSTSSVVTNTASETNTQINSTLSSIDDLDKTLNSIDDNKDNLGLDNIK